MSALLGMAVCAFAEPDGPQPLDEDQVRDAEFLDGLSIPNPGELFAAFGKISRPDWAAFFRRQPPAPHTSRPLIALNLGVRIADGFLAAEAQDRQQVKNVSMEIKLLAKSLGLEQEIMGRSNSIAEFADNRRWDALVEELEAVRGELGAAMEEFLKFGDEIEIDMFDHHGETIFGAIKNRVVDANACGDE